MTGRWKGRARAAGVLAALALLSPLAACTPADQPVTALRLVDGRPTLLVLACPNFNVDSVSVYPGSGADAFEWEINADGEPANAAEIPLLTSPEGWSVREASLTALTPGTEYGVSAFDDARRAVPIHFTLADLEALGPDDVLVGERPSGSKVVSEADFREKAGDSCG
jgi:hypothetical protein